MKVALPPEAVAALDAVPAQTGEAKESFARRSIMQALADLELISPASIPAPMSAPTHKEHR